MLAINLVINPFKTSNCFSSPFNVVWTLQFHLVCLCSPDIARVSIWDTCPIIGHFNPLIFTNVLRRRLHLSEKKFLASHKDKR